MFFQAKPHEHLNAAVEYGHPFFHAKAGIFVDEQAFRRAGAYILSSVMLVLLLLSLALNIAEESYALAGTLALSCLAPIAAFFILWRKKERVGLALLVLNGTMMLLGVSLLLVRGGPYGSSLMWLICFPPMVMLSMGLKRGTILFCIFYLFLLLLMGTSLHTFLEQPFSKEVRQRFLLAMLGAFAFSWWAEFLRHHAYSALRAASYHLEKEANTDALTRLGNRRDFERHFHEVRSRALRDNSVFSLALLDLDHFKRINDTYGHGVGDKILVHLADLMQLHTRPMEDVFRWGGEEFIILLPGVGGAEAFLTAERLRAQIEKSPYLDYSLCVSVTVSIGVYSGDGSDDLDETMRKADRNMYAAKSLGRNRVVSYVEEAQKEQP